MWRVTVLFLWVTTAAEAAPQFVTYTNARYGYSIAYPSSLLRALPESTAGEGRAFMAVSGDAGFRVFGSRSGIASPADLADEVQKICPGRHPSYRVAKPNLVAVSCEIDGHIVYQKTLLRNDGTHITLRGEYPTNERATWDPMLAHMARSMATDIFEQADIVSGVRAEAGPTP